MKTGTIKHVYTGKGTLKLIAIEKGFCITLEMQHIKSVSVFADYEKANRYFNQLISFI